MNVLFITSKPIYPKVDGGCVASANFLDLLEYSGCNVKYLTLSTQKHPFKPEEFPDDLKERIQPKAIHTDTTIKPVEAFKYLLNGRSYNVDRFYIYPLEELIVFTLKSQQFDIVILDNLYSTPYLKAIRNVFGGKVFVRTHNVEHKIWQDLANSATNPVKKAYLKQLSKTLKKYETKTLNAVDGILSITAEDITAFEALGIKTRKIYIPVTIPKRSFEFNYDNVGIFHLGAMDWVPNVEAVQELIGIHLSLLEENPDSTLSIAGKDAENVVAPSRGHNLEVAGFVENLEEYIAQQGILVSPIRSGSGVRIKLLEMMSYGVPIVTTSLGAEGIDTKDTMLIADSKDEILAAIRTLRSDKNKREKLGANARSYINLHHNSESVSKQLIEFIGTK